MSRTTITGDDATHLREPVVPSRTGEVQGFAHAQRTTLALDATAALTTVDAQHAQ